MFVEQKIQSLSFLSVYKHTAPTELKASYLLLIRVVFFL